MESQCVLLFSIVLECEEFTDGVFFPILFSPPEILIPNSSFAEWTVCYLERR